MLSVSLIERALDTRDYDRLLRDLADNGLPLPLTLRLSLGQNPTAPLALALRRLVELTYGPTDLSRRLVDRLLADQRPDGTFPSETEIDKAAVSEEGTSGGDALVTAVALAALGRVAADHPAVAGPEVRSALERGYAALAELQDCDGLYSAPADRSLADRALTTAFIVSLLGTDPAFRGAVRLYPIRRWFERRDGRLDRATQRLWDLADVCLHDLPEPETLAA